MDLTSVEQRRILRQRLVASEPAIMAMVRQTALLDPAEWPDERLLPHTQRGLDRAIAQGLRTQEDVIAFLSMRHQFGERFDEFPAVRDFLARDDLPPDQRIPRMMMSLPLAIWDVVRRRTAPGPSGPFVPRGGAN